MDFQRMRLDDHALDMPFDQALVVVAALVEATGISGVVEVVILISGVVEEPIWSAATSMSQLYL